MHVSSFTSFSMLDLLLEPNIPAFIVEIIDGEKVLSSSKYIFF
jgi:hypothetical protein